MEQEDYLFRFLGILKKKKTSINQDGEIFKEWLNNKGSSLTNWSDIVKLAKAFRNMTVHGALSASKLREWGFKNAIYALSNNLGKIVAVALQKI